MHEPVFAGVLANVQDMTIQDGGRLEVNEMIDLEGNAIEEIAFGSIAIRTRGTMIARNAMRPRILNGTDIRVYPGGLLSTTYLRVIADELIVDVLGVIEADGFGFDPDGQFGCHVLNIPSYQQQETFFVGCSRTWQRFC